METAQAYARYLCVLTKGTHRNILLAMTFNWSEDKNRELKEKRKISFEEIVICIQENRIVTVLEHPNKEKYPNQFLYLIDYKDYIYVVPVVKNQKEEEITLKTICPSREYTKRYLQRGEKNENK
jgi:uncharacterized DUF497 family protein